jgi:hypothetical protein
VQPFKGTSRFRQEWMFGFRFFGLRRKLQHDRALAFAKMREHHDLAVRKFQRIWCVQGLFMFTCWNRATW